MSIDAGSAARLLGGQKSGPNSVNCPGPGHSKNDRSLSVTFGDDHPDGFIVNSFAGDDAIACRDHVRELLGIGAFTPRSRDEPETAAARPATVVCHYVYHDADGEPYLRVTRLSNKSFRQSHWDIDGWQSGKPSGAPVPYRLPDIIARPDEPIYLVEGEKSADYLAGLGLLATTAPGGGAAFPNRSPAFAAWFAGRAVYAFPDNDETGETWRKRVIEAIPDAVIVNLPGRGPKDGADDWLQANGNDIDSLVSRRSDGGITPTPFQWLDPEKIPRREWIYGRHLIRRYVSTTVSPGGLGKSSLVLVEAMALASGRPLLGETVHGKPMRVWYWNGEDPQDETQRRVVAAAVHHGLQPSDFAERLWTDTGRELAITLGAMTRGEITLDESVFTAIESAAIARGIDVITFDPFISTHRVPENDNGAIDAIVKRLAIVAERARCAIELVHHVRKPGGGVTASTDVNDARGASALIGGVRSARVLNVMSKDEADACGVEPTDRFRYFRVDNGKANLAPRSDKAVWRHLASVDLGNGGLALDSSDHVAVVEPWSVPDAYADIPDGAYLTAQRMTDLQPDNTRYDRRSPEWFGYIIGPEIGLDPTDAAAALKIQGLIDLWIKAGHIEKQMRPDAKRRPKPYLVRAGESAIIEASATWSGDDCPF